MQHYIYPNIYSIFSRDKRSVFSLSVAIIYFSWFNHTSSQNLVVNGSFEEHISFNFRAFAPDGSIELVLNWWPSNIYTGVYCHNSIVKKYGYEMMIEKSFYKFDTTNVYDGSAMVKFHYTENCPVLDTGCTSYLKTKLISPLEIGEVYEASMWVYSDYNPAADTSVYHRIGMLLTKYELPTYSHGNMISAEYYFAGKIIPGVWTEIKWHIRALCPLQYLTIGMFRDSSFKSLYRQINNPVHFYIDNVKIIKVNEDSLSTNIVPTPYCEYYEKVNKKHINESITSLDLLFDSNSSTLDPGNQYKLDSFYQTNLDRKDKIFVSIGHTDSEGTENITLSNSRAESVRTYLHERYKINKQSMLTFGLGSAHPIADNTTSKGRLQNRRATIRTSDLTIPQLFYRKGLEYLQTDSLGMANIQFTRWIKMVPLAKRVEMLVDPRLLKLKRSIYWKPLIEDVRKGYSVYPEAKNAFFLDSIYFEDQKFRTYSPYALNGYIEEIDTLVLAEFKFTEQQYNRKDSLNFLAIQKYLDRNGYPVISKVGRRQSRAAGYIILHHFDSLIFERYIPVIRNLCLEGEAEWDVFAKMTDKLCILKGESQVYGTQYDRDQHGKPILYQFDTIEKVNYRRKRIGLLPTTAPE